MGDPRARILRVPIGLGQNLFCLFPWCYLDSDSPYPVQGQLLDAEERFYRAGYVLLDLGPQNLFFQPATGQITIIDPGALLTGDNDRTPGGRAPQDIHDFYLEMLKFYTTPQLPPAEVAGYRDPYGLRPVVNFAQELDEMARSLAAAPGTSPATVEAGQGLFDRVKNRSYPDFTDFRADLTEYLETLRESRRNLADPAPARAAWNEALTLLGEEHWRKYLFDPDNDLAGLTA